MASKPPLTGWAHCCPECDRPYVQDFKSFKKWTDLHRKDCPWRTKEFDGRNWHEYLRLHENGKRNDEVKFDRNNPEHRRPDADNVPSDLPFLLLQHWQSWCTCRAFLVAE